MREKASRVLKTCVLMSCFLTVGMGLVMIGPTLMDLSQQTHHSLTAVSSLLPARSAGYISGSALMGVLFPRIDFQMTATVILLITAICTIAVPFVVEFWALVLLFVAIGVFQAIYETGGYLFAVHLWGKESAVVMQALMFMFGVGSLLAPLITSPFLTPTNLNNTSSPSDEDPELRLYYPYSILGSLLAVNAFLNFVLWFFARQTPAYESLEEGADNAVPRRVRGWSVVAIAIVMVFVFIHYGLDIAFGSYLVTFAVHSQLKLTKSTGAQMTTTFWTCFTIPKLFAGIFIRWTGSEFMILLCMIVTLLGNAILVPFGDKSETCLWFGVAVVGIGMSAVWGAIFAFVDETIGLSSHLGSAIIVAAQTGEFVFPFVISFFIEFQPRVLLWTVLFCSSCTCALFLVLMLMKRTVLRSVEPIILSRSPSITPSLFK